jgi:hypothetical protein
MYEFVVDSWLEAIWGAGEERVPHVQTTQGALVGVAGSYRRRSGTKGRVKPIAESLHVAPVETTTRDAAKSSVTTTALIGEEARPQWAV